MIGYVMVGTNNLDKAIIFYDEVLRILNLQRKDTDEVCAGYCQKDGDGSIEFYVTKPANKKTASFGNGTMVAFRVLSQQIVDKVHELAIKNGGINEGDPGIREGYDNMYFSYFRDLDNNKICVYSEL